MAGHAHAQRLMYHMRLIEGVLESKVNRKKFISQNPLPEKLEGFLFCSHRAYCSLKICVPNVPELCSGSTADFDSASISSILISGAILKHIARL